MDYFPKLIIWDDYKEPLVSQKNVIIMGWRKGHRIFIRIKDFKRTIFVFLRINCIIKKIP